MKTGNVGNAQSLYNQYQNIVKKPGKEKEQTASDFFSNPVDTYTRGVKGAANPAAIEKLWSDTNHFADSIRKLVSSMLGSSDATGQSFWAIRAEGSYKYSETIMSEGGLKLQTKSVEASFKFEAMGVNGGFKLSEAEQAQAQELIGEDGFFGVKQTTARILDFAKALVGEGASLEKIENMRNAVLKGFDEVARMFGGFNNLPDVSKQTYEEILKAFDEWMYGSEEETAEAIPA